LADERGRRVAGRRRGHVQRDTKEAKEALSVSGGLQLVTAFGSPLAIISAVMLYFGWARSAVQARELGVDESVLDMSTRDYLLRAVSWSWLPLCVLALAALVWLRLQDLATARIAAGPPFGTLPAAVRMLSWGSVPFAGILIVILAAVGLGEIAAPLVVAAGLLGTVYGVGVRRLIASATEKTPAPRGPRLRGALEAGLTSALLALLLLWAAENYAGIIGRGYADRIANNVPRLVAVRVYSATRLQLDAPGVTETALSGDHSAYLFRYSGLRLLQKSGGKYFLLSDGWTRDYGAVVVLQESPTLRLEFSNYPR
jgi:hypothetical protein